MRFTKMHGIGNDYVYVNCFQETVEDPAALAVKVSDRHFGIGSDGLILIRPSDNADFTMDMYNADGSRGEMCGNGIRCVAKYVYDYGLTDKTQISVETLGGIKYLDLDVEDGKVVKVKVNMGEPKFAPGQIPTTLTGYTVIDSPVIALEGESVVDCPVTVDGKEYRITCVNMGNPHAVTFMDNVKDLKIEEIGPKFENHPVFPQRINTEFVKVIDSTRLEMRVWERGSGETLACGTGACATAVAAVLNGHCERKVTVQLLGGDLEIFWNPEDNCVYMTGPAATVFDGQLV